MTDRAANGGSSDHAWGELCRLLELVRLHEWAKATRTVLWEDQGATLDVVRDLVDGLRLELLRASAARDARREVLEALELALGHLYVHEWAAANRPGDEHTTPPSDQVVWLVPRAPDRTAARALDAAADKLSCARALISGTKRGA